MAKDEVVLAFFDTEDAADDAVEALKAWDKANQDVKLTSIGVMVLDDKGQLKTHKMGSRSAKKGAGVGLVAAVIFPPSLLAGIVGGGLLGSLHHKSLGLNVDDRNRIAADAAGARRRGRVGQPLRSRRPARGGPPRRCRGWSSRR